MEEVCDLPLRRGRFSSERFAVGPKGSRATGWALMST